MARLSGGGRRSDKRGDAAEPPPGLLMVGYLGLLVGLAGRALGGEWGFGLASAGVGVTLVGGLFFLARLVERHRRRG